MYHTGLKTTAKTRKAENSPLVFNSEKLRGLHYPEQMNELLAPLLSLYLTVTKHCRQYRYKVSKSLRRKILGLIKVMDQFFPAASPRLQGPLAVETLPISARPSSGPPAPTCVYWASSETVREHFLHRLVQLSKLLLKISPSPVFSSLPNALLSNPPTPPTPSTTTAKTHELSSQVLLPVWGLWPGNRTC